MRQPPISAIYLPFFVIFSFFVCSIDKVVAQGNEYDNYKCVVESRHYDVEITRSSDKKTTLTSTLLITGRAGNDYTTIPIRYQKGDKVTINYAHIEDMNGNVIRELKNSDVNETQTTSYGTMYQDYFIKYFQLLHNRYPYRLVYSYSVTEHNYIHLLNVKDDMSLPIREAVVTLTIPDNVGVANMRYKNVSEPEIATIEPSKSDLAKSKRMTKYTWTYSYRPYEPEIMSQESSLGIPEITVTPTEFEYGDKGNFESWESYGSWYYKLNEGLDELPDSEKLSIDNMLDGVGDDLEKMKILYYYMQDRNRYINVSLDIGGMKSYPASYVCANRYGDCKALTTYMKAILKYIGIESYYAPVWLGSTSPEINDNFPNQAFNHVINVVPYKGDTIYLECTSKNSSKKE